MVCSLAYHFRILETASLCGHARADKRSPRAGPLLGAPASLLQHYRFSGGIALIAAEKCAWAAASTGLCLTLVLAGSLPRKLSPFQFLDGLIGLGTKPPPQFGQTLAKTRSTQVAQNVHS
jgi:hypothetical protein